MSKKILSNRKAEIVLYGVFLIGLGILIYMNFLWPGIFLVIWAALAAKQILTGRIVTLVISTAIWWGLFLTIFLKLEWQKLMPALFIVGGLILIAREFFGNKKREHIDE